LSRSRFFAGVALRGLVFDLKQVSRYLGDADLRRAARDRVRARITDDTRVVMSRNVPWSHVWIPMFQLLPG
jgi:hypothetical protein